MHIKTFNQFRLFFLQHNAKLSRCAAGEVGWRAKPGTNLNFLLAAITTVLLVDGSEPEAATLAICCELTAMYSREWQRR